MNDSRATKYWLVVVSQNHMERGKQCGIIQANHGKAAPLKRMHPGDFVVIYSPKVTFEGSQSLKKFEIPQVDFDAIAQAMKLKL